MIRDGADLARVEVDLVVDGQEVRVTREKPRGKDALLGLVVDGTTVTSHTSAATKADIARRIGITYPALLAGPFMLQDDPGSFMSISPADRKNLLLSLLDAARWAEREETVRERATAARSTTTVAQAALDRIPPDLDVRLADATARIDDLTGQEAAIALVLAEAKEALDIRVAEHAREQERAKQGKALRNRLDALRETFTESKKGLLRAEGYLRERAEDVAQVERTKPDDAGPEDVAEEEATVVTRITDMVAATRAYERAQAHLTAAEEHEVTCPGCGLVFHTTGTDDIATLREAVQTAQEGRDAAVTAHDVAQAALGLARRWADWRKADAAAAARLSDATDLVAARRSEVERLAAEGRSLKAQVADLDEGVLDALTSRLEADRMAVRAAENHVADMRSDLAAARRDQDRFTGLAEERDASAAMVAEATEAHRIMSVLTKAFGRDGIPTMLLEGVLPAIEERANEVLGRMPGGFRLTLRTQKATAKGTAAETLDVMVDPGTGLERAYAMLSGGQRFRVDLALRLGLTEALATRSIDTLIVDEGFDRWQDPAGREAVLETLAAVAPSFGLVLVISHHPEVVERFASRIEVSMDEDRISRVTIA